MWVVAKNHEEEFKKIDAEYAELESIKEGAEYYPEWHGTTLV